MVETRASVIVRCKNKAATVGTTLAAIRGQSVEVEIVVVDSGSTDDTLDIVRPLCDVVVEIPSDQFTYGHSLNVGAARASGDICLALSAHSAPASDRWVEWSVEAFANPAVAATAGLFDGPDRTPVLGPTTFGLADLRLATYPTWGMSNHASAWRRSVWEQHPFDENMIACEDKEWMWWALRHGYLIFVDPRLQVGTDHRRAEGIRALFRRLYREHLALASLLDQPAPATSQVVRSWWSDFPYPSDRPSWQRRLSPWRTTELIGEHIGERVGARRRHRPSG